MRKLLSILLLLVFAVPLVAPALGQTSEQRLMLCCRKAGVHHCITAAIMDGDTPAPSVRAHCPACSIAAVSGHAAKWISSTSQFQRTDEAVTPLRVRQVEAGYRISFYRSRQKRGPPATTLL